MLVSIITPTYNRADLLPETIDSILSQDYPFIEYLLLDDGSSDDTQQVLARYAGRIRTDRHPNMGETRTVNKGFGMVNGEIICVVNSDDPLLPGAVREAVDAFRAHPDAVAVYPDWATIDEHGTTLYRERLADYTVSSMLLELNWGIGPGAFFRRDALSHVGPRDVRYTYCGDMEFWLRMALHGPLIHIPKVLATHRVHSGSASVSQRGRIMAMEWIQTFQTTLKMPTLPADVRRERHRILRDAYYTAATHYAAGDRPVRARFLFRAVIHGVIHEPVLYFVRPSARILCRLLTTHFVRPSARMLFRLLTTILRLALRVPRRKDYTFGTGSERFAFCTRFLPPMWSGQAVVIGRLLAGLPPDYYCFATQPVYGNRLEHSFIGTLPGKYYDLPPEKRIPNPGNYTLIRYLNIVWGIVQRGAAITAALKHDPVDTLIGCTGDQIDPPAAFLAAKALRCRYFMYFFDDFTEQWWADPAIQKVIRRIERILALRANGMIVPNEYMQQELKRRYQRTSFVVRNPRPLDALPDSDPPFPATPGKVKLVFTGAIYHLNYDVFRSIIAAIDLLPGTDVKLHLYTAQPAAELIRQGLTGPNVIIHPHLPPSEALEVQRNADILLIPFSFQPAAEGIVRTSATAKLADYLMTGRPVVAICREDSFLDWYLHEFECGVAVPSDEPAIIAEALRGIIGDPSLRERLRRNGIERARVDFDAGLAQRTLLRHLGFRPKTAEAAPTPSENRAPAVSPIVKRPLAPDHMRIVQVSGYDTLGAQVNGFLLHRFLMERGHDSHMVVSRKFSNDENVHEVGGPVTRRLNWAGVAAQRALSAYCWLPLLSVGIGSMPCVANADIVNLQLLHNAQFFSLLQLPLLTRKQRVILSVHDMFLFTGHCVYSLDCDRWMTGCGSCPDLDIPLPVRSDTTALNWKLKRWMFAHSNLDLVVGSSWQRERVQKSPILGHFPLHFIPYGVDTRVYRVRDKAAIREKLGLPQDAHVISFRSVPFRRNFKGGEYIEAALQGYRPVKQTWLLTFEGVGGLDSLRDRYRFLELGWIEDQDTIAEALVAADLFLMPSIAEGFGLMAVESMACGTPVIVFEGTALPETIAAPECGIAVPYKDSYALRQAIERVLGDPGLHHHLRKNGLRHVAAKHGFEAYAEGYLRLYEGLVERTRAAHA